MEREALEYGAKGVRERRVSLADEEYVTLFVGNLKFARIFASPINLRELSVGFLVSEGVVSYGRIKKVSVKGVNAFIEVEDAGNLDVLAELRSSGCSGVVSEEPPPISSDRKFRKETIIKSLRLLDECSRTWRKTGGTHTACLVSEEGKLAASFEDIGRHNAVDKVIGWALLKGIRLDDKFLLFTGRISTGIVYKTVRAGIPLLVSNTAALSKAIQAAEKLNQTTIGFARKGKFTVYTNEDRIE
jgi:FdhD protein